MKNTKIRVETELSGRGRLRSISCKISAVLSAICRDLQVLRDNPHFSDVTPDL